MTQLYSVDICDYGNVLTTPLLVQEVGVAEVLEYYKPFDPSAAWLCVSGGGGSG